MPVPIMGKYQGHLFGEGGEFHQHYKNIKKSVAGDKLKHFLSLNTAGERSKFLLSLPEITQLSTEASKPIYNLEKALEFKEKGNDFFRQHNYGEAFMSYTRALQHCPHDEEKPSDPCNKVKTTITLF